MADLTPENAALVQRYAGFDDDELYRLVGASATEYGEQTFGPPPTLGAAEVLERGRKIVEEARSALCNSRAKLDPNPPGQLGQIRVCLANLVKLKSNWGVLAKNRRQLFNNITPSH